MNNRSNNILSYFIKDIKDTKELAFYKQVNFNNNRINIKYKDEILYEIHGKYCYNLINNVVKCLALKYRVNYKIYYSFCSNFKNLYYKKDNLLTSYNPNYIGFRFNYNKYLKTIAIKYFSNNICLLYVYIIYSNKYKYIINYNGNLIHNNTNKFTSVHILIPNKYELQYYCKFFNIYFVIN